MFGLKGLSAPPPVARLFGIYDCPDSHTLRFAATGQSLTILGLNSDEIRMRYSDAEVSLDLTGIFPPSNQDGQNPRWPRITLDLRGAAYGELHRCYGLWRRVSWFILDALVAWCDQAEMKHSKVDIIGGWIGGAWSDGVYIEFSNSRSNDHNGRINACPMPPYAPTPLDRPAPVWDFHYGTPLSCEVWLETCSGADGRPILNEAVPFAEQIGNVPRFLCDDGSILFFNKVLEQSGPEYASWGKAGFGLLTAKYLLYLHYQVGEAVRRTERPPHPAHIMEGRRLHPLLREEWFFAALEAQALVRRIPQDSLPAMASPDHRFTCKVGAPGCPSFQSPISNGMPLPSFRYSTSNSPGPIQTQQPFASVGTMLAEWLKSSLLGR